MPDPGIRAHQEWLGLIQPVGLVVAPTALVAAQVELDPSLKDKLLTYDALTQQEDERTLPDFVAFSRAFLEWGPEQLAGGPDGPSLPPDLSIALPEFDDRLEPSFAVPDPAKENHWLLLIVVEEADTPLDRVSDEERTGWKATPHERFERLLRETGVGIGLLVSGQTIRLVYAPGGESSGHLSFPVATMATPHGRPMLLALHELLKGWRLSRACPEARGLPRLLEESRKYQNVVSTRLAEQVLGALYELTRGFQAADDVANGALLQATLREAPNEVYGGLLTTIMRLVFVLYAEERGMLPQDAAWVEHYGIGALFQRLRNDRARYPDTMDQRYGAWPQLLSLFRILHDGASHAAIQVPAREGELFDPDRYPFLEGRPLGVHRVLGDRLVQVPRVSDGTLLRVLESLLMLDEERLSYRALDVEQIGSVYEAMMGFEVRGASGRSISVKPKTKKQGSPSHPVVDLDALLARPGADRGKWLKEQADCELPASDEVILKDANNIEGLLEALQRRISDFTPQPANRGALVLVPTEERRRSGSHYTPRELTEPIVATTLRPVLERLGETPTPNQVLELQICDPAMGSGAFLVGTCRYLGERLVEAWQRTGSVPAIPPDEDVQLYARRLVAHRCLFGVDRNPYAVQLAKLSLWLVTLARDHPFTFLDHALRCGDSLVGLTRDQITAFHWKPKKSKRGKSIWAGKIDEWIEQAEKQRSRIEALAGTDDTREMVRLLREADDDLRIVRQVGDAVVAAFFDADTDKKREAVRQGYEHKVAAVLADPAGHDLFRELTKPLREQVPAIVPFHWEIEFPEVFQRDNPGFDVIVGNPPFLGGTRISTVLGMSYFSYLTTSYAPAGHLCDLVAYFFRRAFSLLRDGGAFGLIATNTIAQGDTRAGGLAVIIRSGGCIYAALRRLRWPGDSAVVVSVVHVAKTDQRMSAMLDGRAVTRVSAFLVPGSADEEPRSFPAQGDLFSLGSKIYGQGFLFDDTDRKATPLSVMRELLSRRPELADRIRPYIGGEEVNSSPTHTPSRYAIYLSDILEEEGLAKYPELAEIVRLRVKPERDALGSNPNNIPLRKRWWAYQAHRPAFYDAIASLTRVLAISRVSETTAFTFLPVGYIYSEALVLFAMERYSDFATLQSRIHTIWAHFMGSSLKDDLRYTPSDCFETFPLPEQWSIDRRLETAGKEYAEFRARTMVGKNEGLTATYNRFHNPAERDPVVMRLRDLHGAVDRAVLDAYGWTDLQPPCEFLLDYEDEAEEGSRRRKPWRYRWPDEFRDEVLARLLELNRQRTSGIPLD